MRSLQRLRILSLWGQWSLVGLLVLAAGCASPERANQARVQEPSARESQVIDANTEVFDEVWSTIAESYFDTNFNGLNWDQIREEYRPQAEASTNVTELRKVLQAMLDRLGQSHMAIFPRELADTFDTSESPATPSASSPSPSQTEKNSQTRNPEGSETKHNAPDEKNPDSKDRTGGPGFDIRLVDSDFIVTAVENDSPAAEANIGTGWILKSIDGQDLSHLVAEMPAKLGPEHRRITAWSLVRSLLNGAPGTTTELEFINATDEPVKKTISRRRLPGEQVNFGYLPPLHAHFESQWLPVSVGQIGVMKFNIWLIPIVPGFDLAVDRFREADGMIIDLRGNVGGIAGMIMGMSGHFLAERVSLGTMKSRGGELHFYANPRRIGPSGSRVEPFSGPLAILTDHATVSASEIFAGGLQDIHRARVFGERTAGQALPAIWKRLPNGDVLYFVVADFVTPSGTRLEKRGVIPDVPVDVSRSDYLNGRDPVLEAAIRWIHEQKHPDNRAAN